MKNRGFTLIELLAILVILAIIAIIAVPNILNALEDSRKGQAKVSALGYIEAIEDNNKLVGTDPSIKEISGTNIDINTINVKLKGNKPDSGVIDIDEDGLISYAELCIGEYKAVYENEEVTVAKSLKCKVLTPGLWDSKTGKRVASWDELVNTYHFDIEKNYDEEYYDEEHELYHPFDVDNGAYGNTLYYLIETYFTKYKDDSDYENLLPTNRLSLIIPDGITKIGDYALFHCGALDYVKMPDSITSIGNSSFEYGTQLNIKLSNNLKTIGNRAFLSTSIGNIKLPDSVTTIGADALANCGLSSLNIPANVIEIGEPSQSPIGGWFVEKITVDPDNKKYISIGDAFLYNKNQTILYSYATNAHVTMTIPASVNDILGINHFEHNNLKDIIVDSNNTKYASDDGMIFNKQKTSLLGYAQGSSRKSITIPASVTQINPYVFYRVENLEEVTFEDTSGWSVGNGTNMTSKDVTNSRENAKALKSSESYKIWRKTN